MIKILENEDNENNSKKEYQKLSSLKATSRESTSTDKIEYCYNYNRDGTCIRRGCKYVHDTDPTFTLRSPKEQSEKSFYESSIRPVDKSNRSKKPYAKSPAQLKALTDIAGPPRGVKSDINKDGWSNAQYTTFKSMDVEIDAAPSEKHVNFKSLRVEKKKLENDFLP